MPADPPRARVIAIDGPAASGKSVVGKGVAARLGYRFYDTGAMYRAATWLALRRGIDAQSSAEVAAIVRAAAFDVRESVDGTRVTIDGQDATPHLRDQDVEANVSLVSRVPEVRAVLVEIQRRLAAGGGVVMAGRDIGTVVLPGADLKIYLDASEHVRAARRAAERPGARTPSEVEAAGASIARRDAIDSTRDTSPLTAAGDAVIIDTDEMSIEQVVQRIVELAR